MMVNRTDRRHECAARGCLNFFVRRAEASIQQVLCDVFVCDSVKYLTWHGIVLAGVRAMSDAIVRTNTLNCMLALAGLVCCAGVATAQQAVKPTPPPIAAPAETHDWTHLRLALSPNFSKDPSHYDGPRSSYFIASWTVHRTLIHGRLYLDPFSPREVDNRNVKSSYRLRETVKELFVRRTLGHGVEVTAGDIRATAHSDNNKVLYAGDGKPLHSSIVEIDRVLGASVAR